MKRHEIQPNEKSEDFIQSCPYQRSQPLSIAFDRHSKARGRGGMVYNGTGTVSGSPDGGCDMGKL